MLHSRNTKNITIIRNGKTLLRVSETSLICIKCRTKIDTSSKKSQKINIFKLTDEDRYCYKHYSNNVQKNSSWLQWLQLIQMVEWLQPAGTAMPPAVAMISAVAMIAIAVIIARDLARSPDIGDLCSRLNFMGSSLGPIS